MEVLKDFESLFDADERWKYFGRGESSYLAELYLEVESIELNSGVPEDVKSQFNVAKMLAIYTWNYFPLNQVAELKAFSVLEMALRERFSASRMGLNKLLVLAIEEGFIKDQIFKSILPNQESIEGYSRKLPKVISSMRNDLAHGSTALNHGGVFTLRHCAVIINCLFTVHEAEISN